MMGETAFTHWLRTAERGDVLTYYQGNLAYDRGYYPMLADEKKPEARLLLDEARDAQDYGDSGHVALTQVRMGEDNYYYLATRTRKRLPPAMAFPLPAPARVLESAA